MNKNIIIAAVVAILVLGGGFFIFGQNKGSSTPTPTTTVETTPMETTPTSEATQGAMQKDETTVNASIETKNFTFIPATLTVKAGTKVTFTNRDGAKHSVTSDDGTSFDTGLIGKDESTTFTVPTKPGTYAFHCSLHPNMKGTLVVQ